MKKERWVNRFFKNQILSEATASQDGFDLFFGILFPIICLIADPGIFTSSFLSVTNQAMLKAYVIFSFGFMAIQMIALSYWLLGGRPFAVLAGCLIAGSIFSLALGIVLLPLSLFGLIAVIGILGFTPFFTAIVYFRNGFRILKEINVTESKRAWAPWAVIGFCASLLVPFTTQYGISLTAEKYTAAITSNSGTDRTKAISVLKTLNRVIDTDTLVNSYNSETSTEKKQFIADAYLEITGHNIKERLMELDD